MKAIRIDVYGKVHGVYFRANACQKAKTLNISGTVKNMQDGSVQIIAEGLEQNLNQLIKWCHKGPLLAVVSLVNISPFEMQGYNGFNIIK